MKKFLLAFFVLVLLFSPKLATAGITTVGTTKASSTDASKQWSVGVTPVAGNALLVGCDFNAGIQFVGVSDTAGDIFTQVAPEADSSTFASRAFLATNVKGGPTTVTCTLASATPNDEIFVTELNGVNSTTPLDKVVSVGGPSSPAKFSLTTTNPNEFVWTYIISGQVTNASGWTSLSNFHSNLVASRTLATAGALSASFNVTMNWVLISVALNPVSATIPPPISVSVFPSTAIVQVNQTALFTAAVQNDASNAGVIWTQSGDGSLINATSTSVTFSASSFITTGVAQITATSISDSTKSAVSKVSVILPPDTAAPIVSFSTPTDAQTISGALNILVQATDNVGVSSVQVFIDGASFGPLMTLQPYNLSLDTANLLVGTHIISAAAVDAAGNVGTASISVTVVGELFDITLVYDDGSPYNPGGAVVFSEVIPNITPLATQTDINATVSAVGNVKFRWPAVPSTTYVVVVNDPAGSLLWNTGTELTPQQVPVAFTGFTSIIRFVKATGAWGGFNKFDITY